MITKITIQLPTLSYEHDEHYESRRLPFATKELRDLAKDITSIAQTVSFLNQFPDEPVKKVLKSMTGYDASVKEYTKKKRTYSIPYLTVWEEDINSPDKTEQNEK